MDTVLLRTFVTVAECQGFSAAGKVLHRTQSAVSLQIKRLEDQMGQSLFERNSRSVLLTPHGERLLPYARHMLKLEDEAREALGEGSRGELIRFATSEEQASAYLPDLLPRHARRFPDTRLELHCDMSAALVRQFQEGLLDVVLSIRHLPTRSGQLLGWEPMVWVVAEDCRPGQWETLPLALNPEGCIFRAHALSALGREERRWDTRYASQSPTGLNLPVQAGLAVTVKTPRSVPAGCRIVGENEGLPPLGQVEIELHRRPGPTSEALDAFCEELERIVTHNEDVAAPEFGEMAAT
ncbi:LysR family transcriptional regulator [Halomonas maura]|uniref:LysR family transcriptional regulator n=1 Tax=Halomonas maura TaxID=117606 RepID=UPI0025B4C423|nr:LysR family transcriptional regulator [Halomonas maura]MDN3557723.1 LysR family transcriptional regulator [Halomonas maura]